MNQRRRLLVPEVVQTSAMDCGPATLKCLLGGFGIEVGYDRLREACQTDVDGTSIGTLQAVAGQLGLEVDQVMVPVDHLLLPSAKALPAIVVVRTAQQLTHFVVAWRRHRGLVQVMDPATGRRWPSVPRFLDQVYVHTHPVPAADWRGWAGTESFLAPLGERLVALGVEPGLRQRWIGDAAADPDWRALARVDAATRLGAAMVASGAVRPGSEASRLIGAWIERAQVDEAAIPARYASVRPHPDAPSQLLLSGVVCVVARGLKPASTRTPADRLPAELQAAVSAPPLRPLATLGRMLREDGLLGPAVLAATLVVSAAAVVFEALLLRGLLEIGTTFDLPGHRSIALLGVFAFVLLLLVLQVPQTTLLMRLGRGLEVRLRAAFLERLPRLKDRYFASRPVSDMAHRSHQIHTLRLLPQLAGELLRSLSELILTGLAVAWLSPGSAGIAMLAVAGAIALPLSLQPLLTERDLRVRNHSGALGRYYLDAMLGLLAVRSHGAEGVIEREHERLLVTWARAGADLLRATLWIDGVVLLTGFGLAAWLLFDHLAHGLGGSVLLLVYWALKIPLLSERVNLLLRQYPSQRNTSLRLLEPLTSATVDPPAAPPASAATAASATTPPAATAATTATPGADGVALELTSVGVRAAGHTILDGITVAIPAGAKVAIVGPSGAGKSSLVGLLLGFHQASCGAIRWDGRDLDAPGLDALHATTAWLDPAVQLWNRSFLDNLRYGNGDDPPLTLGKVIDAAALGSILERLPDGLQASLGEGGGLLSGGEGQRVRLGRALLRTRPRLVILDEPFRGLDRHQRRELLAEALRHWQDATVLCVTHDIGETLAFDRVLAIDGGRLVEDGSPAALRADPGSYYARLLAAEQRLQDELWRRPDWRRLRVDDGRLSELAPELK